MTEFMSPSDEITDEDIDTLIAKGMEATKDMNEKMSKYTDQVRCPYSAGPTRPFRRWSGPHLSSPIISRKPEGASCPRGQSKT